MIVRKYSIFDYINIGMMIIFSLIMLYPFIYVLFTSISDEFAISAGTVKYYPSGVNLEAYKMVFQNQELLLAYYNSVRYAALGTVCFILLTSIVAYPFIFKRFRPNKYISIYHVITMFVGGGLVPTYLLYRSLGLVNSIWVMIIPSAFSIYTAMVFKTYFQTMGMELIEASYIDGANDFRILFRILLPLSKPIIATFSLFKIVEIWNNFFTPMIFFDDNKLYPLTLILRKMLIQLDIQTLRLMMIKDIAEEARRTQVPIAGFKSASIVVTILPIICIYPFIQKYFVKGVMIGSLKA
jgi:putative aldouronate transport system permease protein